MKRLIVANWKMYLKKEDLLSLSEVVKNAEKTNIEIVVCPSFIHLSEVSSLIKDSSIFLGAQNCFWETRGAYTGETSVEDLKKEGCQYVLAGHSERRKYFKETNEVVNKKIKSIFEANLVPILCVGETQEEKESGTTLKIVGEQLRQSLEGLKISSEKIIVAYEPVWAIGTGNFCLPDEAEKIQEFIKQELFKNFGLKDVVVLYGGSVDEKNVVSFLEKTSIDGVLVGGASTKKEVFAKLLADSNF